MKVLILTISAGQGHNQTAAALSDYLTRVGVENTVLDAYKYVNQFLSDSVEKGYLMSTHYAPSMFGKFYRMAEKNKPQKKGISLGKVTSSMFGPKLLNYILDYQPTVIVTTHVFTAVHLTYLAPHIPDVVTFGIVTDFTIHPYWENTDMDYYVTATSLLSYQCAKKGISQDKVLPFGIPILEKFSVCLTKSEARKQLGVADKTTILFMMGSMGYGNIAKNVQKIDGLDMDFQIICVCGNNKRAKRNIEKMRTKHRVYVYGYVDVVDVMMDAADFMITKPGGLTLSETLAKALPVILLNPIPGHEDRNREFLVNNGLAMSVSDTLPIDEAVYQFLANKWRRVNLRDGIRYISQSNPTKLLGEYIIEHCGEGMKLYDTGSGAHM